MSCSTNSPILSYVILLWRTYCKYNQHSQELTNCCGNHKEICVPKNRCFNTFCARTPVTHIFSSADFVASTEVLVRVRVDYARSGHTLGVQGAVCSFQSAMSELCAVIDDKPFRYSLSRPQSCRDLSYQRLGQRSPQNLVQANTRTHIHTCLAASAMARFFFSFLLSISKNFLSMERLSPSLREFSSTSFPSSPSSTR